MSNLSPQQLLNALEWRYATKFFDPEKKIPADIWHALEQALVLTPTSYGMQPYQFLVVQDAAKRAALVPHSWNQKQARCEAIHPRVSPVPAEPFGKTRWRIINPLTANPC